MKELILRKWNTGDIKTLAESANNPHIAANMRNSFPCPYTLENAKWYVNDCLETDGKVVGNICIFLQEDVYAKAAELSYWISEDYWGKGIAIQAVKMIYLLFLILSVYTQSLLTVMQLQRAFWKRQALPTREQYGMEYIKMVKCSPIVSIQF